jgi:hypothetical protein
VKKRIEIKTDFTTCIIDGEASADQWLERGIDRQVLLVEDGLADEVSKCLYVGLICMAMF